MEAGDPVLKNTDILQTHTYHAFIPVFLCSGPQSLRALKPPESSLLEDPAHSPGCHP